MKYHVRRGDQDYGPYTLADLQRYMAQGNIVGSDLARAEGTQEWVRVDRIAGNINVQTSPAPPPFEQPSTYGPGLPSAGGPGLDRAGQPMPQGMHWALVLLLSIVTCGIFGLVWMFVEAAYASRLGPGCRAPLFYALHLGGFIVANILAVSGDLSMFLLALLVMLASMAPAIAGHYSIKEALEKHLGLRLNGTMVLLFNVLYFQYHLSEVRHTLGPRA